MCLETKDVASSKMQLVNWCFITSLWIYSDEQELN